MEGIDLESALADWYTWPDGPAKIRELQDKFKLGCSSPGILTPSWRNMKKQTTN